MQEDWKNNFQIWYNHYKYDKHTDTFMISKDDDFDEIFNQMFKL